MNTTARHLPHRHTSVGRLGYLFMASALVSAALLIAPGGAGAQELINSTTALKRACENAVNDFLYVTTDIHITQGPHQDVAGACQIALGPAASFEAVGVSMRFGGAFRIDSSRERSITFARSTWQAPSLEIYGGAVSTFKNDASRLRATAGDITISAGSETKVELQNRPAGSVNALEATRSVSITAGGKTSLILGDTGIQGGSGVEIYLGGLDGLKAERAEVRSVRGPVNVVAPGKALVELTGVSLAAAGGNARVSLAGPDAQLKAESTRISSEGGGVDLSTGGNGSWSGIDLVGATVTATRGVIVQGSSGAYQRYGSVKVAKSTFSGGSDVVFRSGPFGTTVVNESTIVSATAIRVLTGPGGTCTAEKTGYKAPVKQICP